MKLTGRILQIFMIPSILLFFYSCTKKTETKVLVFSKTEGYRHESIEAGVEAIEKLGSENGFLIDATEDAEVFKEENLKNYAAVIFLNTTGDVLNHYQQADFERYIQAGGGFVGIHSAADTEYDWIWFGKLVGGYFDGHPNDPNVRKAELDVLDKNHPSTSMLPDRWERNDEWYNYKNLNPEVNVLINLDETSYEGGTNGENHPIAIYHDFDGGRAFYTGGGHTIEAFSEKLFLQHLLGGIKYAIGNNTLNYTQAHHKRVPAENRFVKTVLAQNLNEPMEMDIFDDGRILIVERKGDVKLYEPETDLLLTVNHIPVHTVHEDGLLGLAIDPNYNENNWVYFFYSPPGVKPVQHVSRFVFADDSIHFATEKVVLEIPLQRDECCHSGGSLEFGPDGNLFIGVGDNTNPFESDGFAPIDERPGRKPFDAQGSAANTNDLRGKILRITPQDDGSYTIPEGNLFAEGTPNTRPEIYIMGCRNPFRFSIDPKTKYLYWGDVGPDAGKDKDDRGPKGIDEFNQAKGPGFYGWPYFRGNDKIYHDYNFATKVSGPLFNPEKPVNDSPNNTGLKQLPPFQPAMIWYSYDKSKEFPWVGVGGKNPMAGPVYYSENYTGEGKFPDYFDGKLLIYEWMRDWAYLLKFDSLGKITKIDPFMPNTANLSNPMDMLFGKDGKLYVLEYGKQWFSRNLDARLSRIDYIKGNRAPVAKIKADKTVGAAPLTVTFSAEDSYDFDKDELSYEWTFNGSKSNEAKPRYTFKETGIFRVKLKVTDPEGRSSTTTQEIQIGNEPPRVNWEIAGNQTFYWDNREVNYVVKVSDKEDGGTDGNVNPERIKVSFDYMAEGLDITQIAQGHQVQGANKPLGLKLIEGSDCKTCHAEKIKINGPSYQMIAERYSEDEATITMLADRVRKGSSGVWGSTAMAAHPQLSMTETKEIVKYILSLGGSKKVNSKFPPAGKVTADKHLDKENKGYYILMASYTDQGNGEIKPITVQSQIILRNNRILAKDYDEGTATLMLRENKIREIFNDNYLAFKELDLTDISSIMLNCEMRNDRDHGGVVEIRTNGVEGEKIGEISIEKPGQHSINISPIQGKHDVYLVFKATNNPDQQILILDWLEFNVEKENIQLSDQSIVQ